jgi:hypothetical protein
MIPEVEVGKDGVVVRGGPSRRSRGSVPIEHGGLVVDVDAGQVAGPDEAAADEARGR